MPSQIPPAQDSSDAALLAEAAAGGEAAFIELYRRRRDDVYRFAPMGARVERRMFVLEPNPPKQ